ncbi:unnamed protein product [Sphagnum compactum]
MLVAKLPWKKNGRQKSSNHSSGSRNSRRRRRQKNRSGEKDGEKKDGEHERRDERETRESAREGERERERKDDNGEHETQKSKKKVTLFLHSNSGGGGVMHATQLSFASVLCLHVPLVRFHVVAVFHSRSLLVPSYFSSEEY